MRKILFLLAAAFALAHAIERPPQLEALPDDILHADLASNIAVDYHPTGEPQIIHFDAQGEKADAAVKGGYYRKVLGKTDDGRAVVQDFYQDNDQPQTDLTILVKDADVTDFGEKVLDSRSVWYRPDGSLLLVVDFKNGREQSASSYYRNGRLFLQTGNATQPLVDSPPSAIFADSTLLLQIFHDNGIPSHRMYEHADNGRSLVFYRHDGSPITAALVRKDGSVHRLGVWNATGKRVNLRAVEKEYSASKLQFEQTMNAFLEELTSFIPQDRLNAKP